METRKQGKRRLAWDIEEDQKLWVFMRLNELARKRNVAILYIYRLMKDYAGRAWNDMQLHYSGPLPAQGICLFCGKPTVDPDDCDDLGGFVLHDDCFDESVNDWHYDFYLEPAPHRPAVIILERNFPGSIDNVVLGVAWGLGVHYVAHRRHLPSSQEALKTADVYARRLVRQIQMPRIRRRVN